MPTWNLAETVSGLSVARSLTKDGDDSWAGELTSGQVDLQVDFDFVYTRVGGFAVECPGAIKIETNAVDASGGDTLNVPAGGMVYMAGGVEANPFSADVTKIYVTDMSSGLNTASGCVKIKVLYDRTP